jgi:hypothetical protein
VDHETHLRRRVRWFALGIALLGICIFMPSLRSPFLLDDYLHASMVNGTFPASRSPFDLYDFVTDADRGVLFARGILPWWTHPHLTIRFFRPLSSGLLWIDHALYGHRPVLLHLQSFAWWLAAVLALRALYARTFRPRVTLLATTIFAFAPCHAIPLAWIANREALVSLALGTMGLGAYLHWRDPARAKGRRARDAALAAMFFGLAMLGGEYALSFAGYVLAFELLRRGAPVLERVVGTLPFALPAAIYLGVRAALHYGAAGSAFYSDPMRDPLTFLRTVPWRVNVLLVDGWWGYEAEAGPMASRLALASALGATTLLLVVPMRRMFKGLAAGEREAASWLLLGSLFAIGPVLAVVPSPRLLGTPMIGIAAVVALLLDRAWFPRVAATKGWSAELTGLAAIALGFAHLVHGPVTAWLAGKRMRDEAVNFMDRAAWLRDKLSNPLNAEIAILRGNADMFFGPFALDPTGAPPKDWRVLAYAGHVLVRRQDARTLELIVPPGKGLFPVGAGDLFRSADLALRPGDEIDVATMHVRILETGPHGPTRARFVFDEDIDQSPYVWVTDDHDGFHDAKLPAPGFGAPFDP